MDKMSWLDLFLSLKGRINRGSFWFATIAFFFFNAFVLGALTPLTAGAGLILSILSIYPGVAVAVKRCHDRGKSGWWCLLLLIPVIGWIWWFIDLGLLEGDTVQNEYGPIPA